MQFGRGETPPLGVVFDGDVGIGVDDLLALAMIYATSGREDVPTAVASTSTTTSSLEAAAFCEAVRKFYTDYSSKAIPEQFRRGRDAFVGLAEDGPEANISVLTKVLEQEDESGEPLYETSIKQMVDTADPAALIRNALTAYHDQNTVVILTGPATNLAKVLSLNGAKELIAAKVKVLAVAGGAFPSGGPERNVKTDIEAARKLFAEWPSPIVVAGTEIGDAVPFPSDCIEDDFGWTEHHPIADAYRAAGQMPYDTRSASLAATLYGLRPEGGHFGLSEPGTVQVMDDGSVTFTPSPDGNHRYLTVDDSQKEDVLAAYRDFVASEPPPRELPRRLQRLLEEQAAEEAAKKEQEQQNQEQQDNEQ